MTGSPPGPPQPPRARALREFHARHERVLALAAFVAGFVFDVLTLPRVDSWLAIGQQALYLLVIGTILTHMLVEDPRPEGSAGARGAGAAYRRYRMLAVHFLFGSLLNLYTIYYFKSASLLVSFAFMLVLVLLLAANEMPRFKALGLAFKFALLALCCLSLSAHVMPIVVGRIGTSVFLLSIALGAVPLIAVAGAVSAGLPRLAPRTARQVLAPLAFVTASFLGCYLLHVIPPVPLSIPFMGIYHSVEKTAAGYRLERQRPTWRFWHRGDQEFLAQPGDRVYVFFRLQSPTRFADQVRMRWYRKSSGRGWEATDTIAVDIVGGREEGFRGYGYKSRYTAGNWRVQVETADGREIGRIYFRIRQVPAAPRRLVTSYQ